MGPTFSVITIRPSGRNPSRHGRLNVATLVMTNGKMASVVCAPRLVWAGAPDAVKAANTAVFASFIFHLPRIFGRRGCEDFGRSTTRINETGLEVRRAASSPAQDSLSISVLTPFGGGKRNGPL